MGQLTRRVAFGLGQTIEMDPDHPMPYLPQGLAYSMKGMHDDAIRALRRGLDMGDGSSEMLAQLAHAYGRAGRRDQARALLEKLRALSRRRYVSPFSLAVAHIGVGESEAALDWLERGYDARDWYLCVLRTDSIFHSLRGNARFEDLLRRMQFPA